jgi:regulator of protease activity HflC (stomatin/prohibitin superfamily)
MDERDLYKVKEAVGSVMQKIPIVLPVIIGILIIILLFFRPFVQIGAGERGVVLNFGAVQDVALDEGLHFRVPIMQAVIPMDVKVQKSESEAAAASSDLQDVS